MSTAEQWLRDVAGRQLGSVVFVQDYWQFHFDGLGVTALTRVIVHADGSTFKDGDDQFRNLLCGQITKVVARAQLVQPDALTIFFMDGSSIAVSLKSDDYRGPEALHLCRSHGDPLII